MKCWAGKAQAGIKTAERNINILRYADDTTSMAESKEELNKDLLDEGRRGTEELVVEIARGE